MPGSHIGYSILFEEMEAAKEWGLTPDDWFECSRSSRAVMVAQRRTRSAIDFWLVEDRPKPKV
jgi:hypothetical protein